MTTTYTRPESVSAELRAGVRDMLVLLVGFAPFAVGVGAAVAACASPVAGWAGTWLFYGGSAHLTILHMDDDSAALGAVIATALVINTRLIVYGVGLGRHWRDESVVFKVMMAATIVDPSFALTDARYREAGSAAAKRAYAIGVALTLWFGWMGAVTAGVFVGSALGDFGVMQLAAPLCFATLLVPALRKSAGRCAAATAAVITLAASNFPAGTGLLAGIVGGAVVGALAERGTR